jgi:hypothetical protein
MPNVSLARSASHFRVQESEDKNRETREKHEKVLGIPTFRVFRAFRG